MDSRANTPNPNVVRVARGGHTTVLEKQKAGYDDVSALNVLLI